MSQPSSGLSIDTSRAKARELHAAGKLTEAIQLQIHVVNSAVQAGQVRAEDYHRLGVMLFAGADYRQALKAFQLTREKQHDFPDVAINLGLCLILNDQPREAIPELLQALTENVNSLDILDGLAHAYGKLGDLENARTYGERSLLEKDRRANPPPAGFVLPAGNAPPFRIDRPQENVIAFSLFGNKERYIRGALKNAVIAGGLYPGWRCRYYVDDTVPAQVRSALAESGAEVKLMPRPPRFSDGLFWRFLVLDDPSVVRFMIRDCDSVLNIRERKAVEEWLASGKLFHVMRDNAAHTDLMLAGLWGGVARQLPPVSQLVQGFSYNPVTESRTADQQFLGRIVWPLIKGHCLIHDRVFRAFGAKDFPPGADLLPGRHVGDDDSGFKPDGMTLRNG